MSYAIARRDMYKNYLHGLLQAVAGGEHPHYEGAQGFATLGFISFGLDTHQNGRCIRLIRRHNGVHTFLHESYQRMNEP